MDASSSRDISLVSKGTPLTLQFSETHLVMIQHDGRKSLVDLRQVLRAELSSNGSSLEVYYVTRKRNQSKGRYLLAKVEGILKDRTADLARVWVQTLMDAAYAGVKPFRRLKVLLNPFGGTRKGPSIWTKTVEPIFRAAGCRIDMQKTTHSGHGHDLAKALELDKFDAIVTASGDGLLHEVLNGLSHHATPRKALAMPVAPIPTGSGNGLSHNLLGLNDGLDHIAAALNVIKGRPMKIDLFAVSQGDKVIYSFMSQTMGLMADVDLGTEHLRWMGDTRFYVGFIRGIMTPKPCPFKMWIKPAETDKHKMVAAQQDLVKNPPVEEGAEQEEELPDALPLLQHSTTDTDGWIEFDKPKDFMPFPVSLPGDGLIDLCLQELTTRGELLTNLAGAEKGESYWMSTNHYTKAHAYRIKPTIKTGNFAVDGESMPFEEYQVEVHPRLGTLLSPTGYWAADLFDPKPPSKHAKATSTPIKH